MTWSRMQSRIATLLLGLALMGGMLPLTVQPADAAESSVSLQAASLKGVRASSCRRQDGRRGPCL